MLSEEMIIIQGDAQHIPLADNSVQCVVTSPPYWGLRDYGVEGQLGLEPTPEAYVANLVAVFREVRRVLRTDGVVWINLGDSYAGSGRGLMGNGTPSDRGGAKQGTNRGTTVGNYPKQVYSGLKHKDLVGIPWRVAFALQADGWWLRSDVIWAKPNPMPESVTDRPTKSHEYVFLLTKSARYYYDSEAVKEPKAEATKGRDLYRGHGHAYYHDGNSDPKGGGFRGLGGLENTPVCLDSRNRRTVWTIATKPFREAHFAVMPTKLVEPCVLAGSKAGDVVLDPFAGSGTVGVVARKHDREFVGVDLNFGYCKMALERMAKG